jgi:dienelactone hydrolase
VKDQASKLADQASVSLSVDLYGGKVATTSEEAHEITRGVPEDRVKRDLLAAFDFLASQPMVKNVKKNGSVPSNGAWAAATPWMLLSSRRSLLPNVVD